MKKPKETALVIMKLTVYGGMVTSDFRAIIPCIAHVFITMAG